MGSFVKTCEDVIMYSTVFKVYFFSFCLAFNNNLLQIIFVLILPQFYAKSTNLYAFFDGYLTSFFGLVFDIFDKVETLSFSFLAQKGC